MQVNREDATFLFAQERALMIVSGSWDISTFQKQCQFPIAVAEIPLPTRGHPVHGQFLFSKSVESAFGNENFGVMSRRPNTLPYRPRDYAGMCTAMCPPILR